MSATSGIHVPSSTSECTSQLRAWKLYTDICDERTQVKKDNGICNKCCVDKRNEEPGESDSEGSRPSSYGESSEEDDAVCNSLFSRPSQLLILPQGTTLGGTFSNLSLTNGSSAGGGGVALSNIPSSVGSFVPPHLRGKGPKSAVSTISTTTTSADGKWAKNKAVLPKSYDTDAARRCVPWLRILFARALLTVIVSASTMLPARRRTVSPWWIRMMILTRTRLDWVISSLGLSNLAPHKSSWYCG
jgi:hypothetical protein